MNDKGEVTSESVKRSPSFGMSEGLSFTRSLSIGSFKPLQDFRVGKNVAKLFEPLANAGRVQSFALSQHDTVDVSQVLRSSRNGLMNDEIFCGTNVDDFTRFKFDVDGPAKQFIFVARPIRR